MSKRPRISFPMASTSNSPDQGSVTYEPDYLDPSFYFTNYQANYNTTDQWGNIFNSESTANRSRPDETTQMIEWPWQSTHTTGNTEQISWWPPLSQTTETSKVLPSYGWVDSDINKPLPNNAVKCCTDEYGHDVYIGQTAYKKFLVGVKIIPAIKKAYAAYLGDEVEVEEYMVLVNYSPAKPVWVKSKSGGIKPTDAVFCGYNSRGLKLYVARGSHKGHMVPGYFVTEHDVIYVPYGGKEHYLFNFEVLVNRPEE